MLRGQQVHPDTRMVVVPASREVYLEALRRGYIEIFTEAGALVEAASCGPCIGRHQGVLSAGERALTTMNRNFTGRMGDPTAEIYLGSPATIAALGHQGRHHRPARRAGGVNKRLLESISKLRSMSPQFGNAVKKR